MLLARWATKSEGRLVQSAADLGLNKLTPSEFRALMRSVQWSTLTVRYNRGGKAMMKLFNVLRRIPGLERYFTVSIYAVATMP